MPAGTSNRPSSLLQAVNYHTYDDAWVPDVLAGKTTSEVGDTYESLKLTSADSAIKAYDTYNQIASNAVTSIEDLEQTVHLSYGDFPVHEYLRHVICFRAFRSYDIAKMIGVETTWPQDFTQALWDELASVVDAYRQMGVFPRPLLKYL